MRLACYCMALALFTPVAAAQAQQVIELDSLRPARSEATGSIEKEYFSATWGTRVVTNVTTPSLIAFLPDADVSSGAAVIVCPGGGFYALSIDREGIDTAKWLARRGIAAFVLKYRLVPTGEDGVKEVMEKLADLTKFDAAIADAVPAAVADAFAAVEHLRENAGKYRVSPDRIGLLGFSAGGTVAASVAFEYSSKNRPAFVAPIYPYMRVVKPTAVPADAPPMFIVVATNDQLGLAKDSANLYLKWTAAKKPAEFHAFAKGGHGFGMQKNNLPSDRWIDHFVDWLEVQGILKRPG